MTEYVKWPTIKRKIFDWSITVGHHCAAFRSRQTKIKGLLKLKEIIADKLVLKKLRSIFGGKMRTMPCSGAAIRQDLLEFFHATGLFINYGYGATETTATVSCFRTDRYEFESVGSIMPGVEVKISESGEIMVKGRTIFKGYYKKPAETNEALKKGWYYTGDEGYISKAGNLVMTDRLKDLFKTSVGKYVSPQKIELLLGQDPFIEQVITIGDNRKYITALIVPVMDNIKAHANMLGLKYDSIPKLFARKEIQNFFRERIDNLQSELADYEKIVNFKLLSEPFTIENNAMTSTLKFRRKVIMNQYEALIEEMY
jgi:long-chain acyl-CoA synthetase